MEGHRFDALARQFADGSWSRRRLLTVAGGGLAGAWSGLRGGSRTAFGAPAQPIDIVAAPIQTTDPSLGGNWQVLRSEWTDNIAALTSISPELSTIVQTNGGVSSAALLTLATAGADGQPTALVKSILLQCHDDAVAEVVFGSYQQAVASNFTPLDAASLLGESTDALIGTLASVDDPDFLDGHFDAGATLTFYREADVVAGALFSGTDQAFAAKLGKSVIERLTTGNPPGHGLAGQLAFVDFGLPVTTYYSRLDGIEQRNFGADDALFAAQKLAEGDATDFARTSQLIPTTEPTTFFRVHTWAGRHKSTKRAQAWVDGTLDRLTAQAPGAQFVAIDEANGLGDASEGFLYTISDAIGVGIGVDLYVRVGSNILAVGLSAESTDMTPGMTSFFDSPLSLGKGAQALIGAQLAQASSPTFGPRPVPIQDVFGDSPLQPANIQENASGPTSKDVFTACSPSCRKRVVQDQTTPYQVWCQANGPCTDAKCTCNLFRTKNKTTTSEWFGKQNEKKEYDPDNYSYSCSCGTIAST